MGAAQSSQSLALETKTLERPSAPPADIPLGCACIHRARIRRRRFYSGPLQAGVIGKYPRTYALTYLPFSLMLVGGAGSRITDFTQRRRSRKRCRDRCDGSLSLSLSEIWSRFLIRG